MLVSALALVLVSADPVDAEVVVGEDLPDRTVISARPAGSASPSDSAGPWVICVESSSWSRSPTCSASPWKTTSKSPPNRPITGLMSPTACAVMSLATAWLTLTVTSWYPGTATGLEWIHASSGVRSSVRSRLRRTSTSVTASVPAWRANVEDGRRTAPTSSAFLARSARMVSERLSSVYLLVSSMATPPGRSASTERSMK